MAKRPEPFKEFGRSTKKPKLDITINKGRPVNTAQSRSTLSTVATTSAQCTGLNYFKPTSPVKCSQNNFWDDDDDDVILLATQVAETEVAAAAQGSILASQQIKESEITFSEFEPNLRKVNSATSTQRLPNAPVAETVSDPDLLSDLFNDDDDDAFAMMVCEDFGEPKQQQRQQEQAPKDDPFKRPFAPNVSAAAAESFKTPAASVSILATATQPLSQVPNATTVVELPSSQSAARRQLASERQIKFLMERVDALKKENLKLSKDMLDTKSKMESKDGETSLLRDELRHMKQQMQSLKMEKIYSTEATKTECKSKIAELSKQVEAKQTELQLKSVEYSVLKMRHADETKRFEQSMRNDSMMAPIVQTVDVPETKPVKKKRSLFRLRGLTLRDDATEGSDTKQLPPAIFEHAQERGTSKKQRTLFQLELEEMQAIVAQLQQKEASALGLLKQDELKTRTIASACKVFPEFWTYVHSLEFLKNCRVHPYHAYDLSSDCSDAKRQSIHQVEELHKEERALSLRRYVASLSVVCSQLPTLSMSLLCYQHGEYMLLQIAIDALNKLGFSLEICEHFGLLEAFAVLLHSLLLSVAHIDVDEKSATLIVALMKSLIFCRPSPWVFRHISCCLLECRKMPQTLPWFCVNSASQTFLTDRVQSIYRFSIDSCLLQVYAGLLEIAFPLYTPLRPKHFSLLSAICEQHVRFIYLCFEDPPKFIHDNLPSYDDDDEEEEQQLMDVESNASMSATDNQNDIQGMSATCSSATNDVSTATKLTDAQFREQHNSETLHCECYTKLCLSLVTLLFQLLRQWELSEKKQETSRVEQISKMSIKLLHTIFCDNYITRLFRDAEETTKHYLHLICKWWTESAQVLHFNEIQIKILEKLKSSHIMPKQLSEEHSPANVAIDLAEWYRTTNDDKSVDPNDDAATAATSTDGELIGNNLKLLEDAIDAEQFFEAFKGYAYNFE